MLKVLILLKLLTLPNPFKGEDIMNYIKSLIFILMCIVIISSCGPIPDIREIQEIDLRPPVLNSIISTDCNKIAINLDETAYITENNISIYPELEIINIHLHRPAPTKT